MAGDAYSHWCSGTSHPECDEHGRTEGRQDNDGLLVKGDSYDVGSLVFCRWTAPDSRNCAPDVVDGYHYSDYFEADGTYKGADEFGVEPIFEAI